MTTQKMFFALLFVLAVTALSTSQDRRSRDFETIEGTWIVDLTPAPPRRPQQILVTFARGGTLVADANAARPTLRSPWHGVWARLSYLDFITTWERWEFDEAGRFAGRAEDRMAIAVDGTLETFSGNSKSFAFDQSGNLVASADATFRATRVNVKAPE